METQGLVLQALSRQQDNSRSGVRDTGTAGRRVAALMKTTPHFSLKNLAAMFQQFLKLMNRSMRAGVGGRTG